MSFRPAQSAEMIHYTTERDYKPAEFEHKQRVLDEIWNIYADDDQVMVKLI
eukprot:SAG11_NODE_43897_length_160_cov_192.918033_1_plen_50_part_01